MDAVVVRSELARLWRLTVVTLLVAGVLVGAASCASGLATGLGHRTHAGFSLVGAGTRPAPTHANLTTHPAHAVQQDDAQPNTGQPNTGQPNTVEHSAAGGHRATSNDLDQIAMTVAETEITSAPSPATGRVGDAHPGMACMTSARFAVPDLVVRPAASPARQASPLSPPTCVVAPEPPVPKIS